MKIKRSISKENKPPKPDDTAEISRLYLMYKEPFIAFVISHFEYNRDLAEDIYQESFISLYLNLKQGRVKQFTTSCKTYLFQIGKFKILNQLRQNKNRQTVGLYDDYCDNMDYQSEEQKIRDEIVCNEAFSMQEPCCTVLSLYYWEGKDMNEIAKAMNYKSEQVAKNRKSLCMKKLKTILAIRFKSEELIK